MGNDGVWKCPACGTKAEVKGRTLTIYIVGHIFPRHNDCEFAKTIDDIDFLKLERIGASKEEREEEEGEGGGEEGQGGGKDKRDKKDKGSD